MRFDNTPVLTDSGGYAYLPGGGLDFDVCGEGTCCEYAGTLEIPVHASAEWRDRFSMAGGPVMGDPDWAWLEAQFRQVLEVGNTELHTLQADFSYTPVQCTHGRVKYDFAVNVNREARAVVDYAWFMISQEEGDDGQPCRYGPSRRNFFVCRRTTAVGTADIESPSSGVSVDAETCLPDADCDFSGDGGSGDGGSGGGDSGGGDSGDGS